MKRTTIFIALMLASVCAYADDLIRISENQVKCTKTIVAEEIYNRDSLMNSRNSLLEQIQEIDAILAVMDGQSE